MSDSKFPPEPDDNTIDLSRAREEREAREKALAKEKAARRRAEEGPMFNLPPVIKILLFSMIGIFTVQELFLDAQSKSYLFINFGFVPISYFSISTLWLPAIVGPITYMFLHLNLFHILMNGLMMAAFGSAVERWLGSKRFLILFIGCGLIAVLCHYLYTLAFNGMGNPVIGASGAVSGLFAAALVMLKKTGTGIGAGKYGLWPFIGLWIAISALFGLTSGEAGGSIAWVAHIGGFMAGFVFLRVMKFA